MFEKNKGGRVGGVQIFPIKMEGLVKEVGLFFKKGWGITYFHTNPFQCHLSLSVWCVCVCFVHLHHFISIMCVSPEEPSLITSNQ